jgi:hypothetical protein
VTLPMSTRSILHGALPSRRRRVRHRFRRPVYASLSRNSQTQIVHLNGTDFNELLDISEDGLALKGRVRLDAGCEFQLFLELDAIGERLYARVQVVWSDAFCRSGLRFIETPPSFLRSLREWMFIKAISSWSEERVIVDENSRAGQAPSHVSQADALARLKHLQVQLESVEADPDAGLDLIARTAQELTRASAAAIALRMGQSEMICRASSGSNAPPLGAEFNLGSGFSGLCVRSRTSLICRDTESDLRVDRNQCRALGVRSLLAAPVSIGAATVGLIEVFSPHPDSFTNDDTATLAIVGRVVINFLDTGQLRRKSVVPIPRSHPDPTVSVPTSLPVLGEIGNDELETLTQNSRIPRAPVVLICVVVVMGVAFGLLSLWIRRQTQKRPPLPAQPLETRLQPEASASVSGIQMPLHLEDADIATLKQLASQGSAEAQNALGQRYLEGDARYALVPNDEEALHWFSIAAERGNVAAQSKLGFLFWSGRGVPQNFEKAYFWATIASMNADASPRDPMVVLARDLRSALAYSGLNHAQATVIERQAQRWRPRK